MLTVKYKKLSMVKHSNTNNNSDFFIIFHKNGEEVDLCLFQNFSELTKVTLFYYIDLNICFN